MNMFMDKVLAAMQLITSVGRKLTAVIFANACLTAVGVLQIVILHAAPNLCYWMIAGVTGFFFGFNILGDHIFNGANEGTKDDINAKPPQS